MRPFPLGPRGRFILTLLATTPLPVKVSAQQGDSISVPDTVRGIVREEGGKPIERADVVLTRGPDMAERNSQTDVDGRFAFAKPGGSGEYLLAVSATGYRPVRRRLVGAPANRVLVAVLVLQQWSPSLQTVEVLAERAHPQRRSDFSVGAGATERLVEGSLAVGPPLIDGLSDLARASVAGVSTTDGWSVAGLPAAESQTQLNGLLFRGNSIPRNIPRRIRLSASTYDIANSGFSGGLVAIELPRAGEFRNLAVDAAVANREAMSPFLRPSPEIAIDAGGDWRTRDQKWGFSGGARLAVQRQWELSLANASDAILTEFGADPTVARTATQLLSSRSPAFAMLGETPVQSRVHLSALARFEPILQPDRTNAFIIGADLSSDPASTQTPLAAPTLGSRHTGLNIVGQWQRRWISNALALWDWNTGISLSGDNLIPALPRVATIQLDTRATAQSAVPGTPIVMGGTAGRERKDGFLLESTLQRDVFAGRSGNHRVRLIGAARLDAMRQDRPATTATLGFASLADFEASVPDWASTSVGTMQAAATVVRISTGLGDEWRSTPRLKLQYGLRLDAQGFQRPLSTTFEQIGTRNIWGRTFVSMSPRFGLSWNVMEPKTGEGYRTTNLFSRHLLPSGIVNFGFGIFQRDFDPDMALGRSRAWGPIATRWCGPLSNQGWTLEELAPEVIEQSCAASNGSLAPAARQSREVISPTFAPPSSFRATTNFLWSWRQLDIELGGLWNEAMRQPGLQDLALVTQPRSILTGEGNRTFFSPDIAIDPATGIVRPDLSSSGGLVQNDMLITSDRRSRATQFMIQLSPRLIEGDQALRLGYVWTRSRSLEGGWDRDTFGDPHERTWGPSRLDRRHQFQLESGKEIGRVSFLLWTRASSGVPFSPLVAGDVNGDGDGGNDRAFIPLLPPNTGASLVEGFPAFIASAPKRVVSCLARQSGSPAERGSCRGPWTVTSSFLMSAETRTLSIGRRGMVTLAIENLGALADRLINGSRERGWGNSGEPDPFLLRVTGFDSLQRAFRYAVNPQFGRIPKNGNAGDGYRISLSFEFPLAPPIERQQIERWLRARGVGDRMPVDSLATRFARNVASLYETVLEESDALFLQPSQLAWIAAERPQYEGTLGQLWKGLAMELSDLPAGFDVEAARQRVDSATDRAWELNRVEAHRLRDILTPIQLRLLPWPASVLVHAESPVRFRVTYY